MKIKEKLKNWKDDHEAEIMSVVSYGCFVAGFVGGLCLWANGVKTGAKARDIAMYRNIKQGENLKLIKCFDIEGNPITYDELAEFMNKL